MRNKLATSHAVYEQRASRLRVRAFARHLFPSSSSFFPLFENKSQGYRRDISSIRIIDRRWSFFFDSLTFVSLPEIIIANYARLFLLSTHRWEFKKPRSHDFQLFTIILRGIGRIIFTSPVVIQESRNWGTAEFSSGWIDPSKSRREAE